MEMIPYERHNSRELKTVTNETILAAFTEAQLWKTKQNLFSTELPKVFVYLVLINKQFLCVLC